MTWVSLDIQTRQFPFSYQPLLRVQKSCTTKIHLAVIHTRRQRKFLWSHFSEQVKEHLGTLRNPINVHHHLKMLPFGYSCQQYWWCMIFELEVVVGMKKGTGESVFVLQICPMLKLSGSVFVQHCIFCADCYSQILGFSHHELRDWWLTYGASGSLNLVKRSVTISAARIRPSMENLKASRCSFEARHWPNAHRNAAVAP